MAYTLREVELTEPLTEMRLGERHNGVGIISRRDGHVVGFAIHPLAPGTRLAPSEVAALLDPHPAAPSAEDVTASFPTGAVLWFLPPSPIYTGAGRRLVDPYAWSRRGAIGEVRGRRTIVAAIARAAAPYLTTTPVRLARGLRREGCRSILCQEYEEGRLDVCVAVIGMYLAAADVYVFPCRQEGFPVSPVEAMAAGLPIVATDAPGVRAVVGDPDAAAGVVVPRGDPVALARELRRLLDDDQLAATLEARALLRVSTRFSLDAVGTQLRAFMLGP